MEDNYMDKYIINLKHLAMPEACYAQVFYKLIKIQVVDLRKGQTASADMSNKPSYGQAEIYQIGRNLGGHLWYFEPVSLLLNKSGTQMFIQTLIFVSCLRPNIRHLAAKINTTYNL
uniref:Uncharacterized protein n=1 Tax=Glossina austeni TaxID=7395 RepID=A0A1A9UR75_GLOAU